MLLDIYAARELPIKGIDATWLLNKIENKNKKLTRKKTLLKDIQQSSAKVVAMLGAGDIGVMISDITNQILKSSKNEI